jgi:fructoselysine transporter
MQEPKRGLSLLQATSINMIDMVGIGPFVVLPMVIKIMGGPWYLLAWVAGALISFIDAFIWSELGAAYPKAGGSYNFLKEAYGRKWGKLLSFLYVWQTIIQAPLVAASGAIGFAQYCKYLFPLTGAGQKFISGGLIILLVLLLYRKIETIGKISVVLWSAVIVTIVWIIYGGMTHRTQPFEIWPDHTISLSLFFVALGQASVKTVYSYLGYYNVCHLGGEINRPEKNIPRSIFISIAGISLLYLLMNISVTGVIPWQEAANSDFIISTFIERIYGHSAAMIATGMILLIAFASLFAVLLGYSRIPYAAAVDGRFFKIFARLHPTKNFPHVSLLFLGGAAFIFSLLFRLSEVISAILAMRILIQFIGQAVGVVFLRKQHGMKRLPFKMPLYPFPVIIAILVWLWIFISTGKTFVVSGMILITSGIIVYFLVNKLKKKRQNNSTSASSSLL